jgi:transcription elongation factor GreA
MTLDEIKGRIEHEIERLTHELSITLPLAIRKAVELGDLRENGEYHSALERQNFVQARIDHLRKRMAELSRIDVNSMPADRAGFGSRLTLRNLDTGDDVTYTLVAGDYMDLDSGQISLASPIGRATLGREKGEEFAVQLPIGERRFRIVELTTLPQMLD